MRKTVTLKDIAAELKISLGTIDRAINDRGGISPETKNRVLEKLKEANYSPNKIARRLALKRITKIGVILFVKTIFFWSEVERGIKYVEKELRDFGIEVIFYRIGNNSVELEYAIDKLVNEKVDAMIVRPIDNTRIAEKLNKCIENGIHIVTINENIDQVNKMFSVGPQDFESGIMAGQLMGRLVKKGKVAIVSYPYESHSLTQRYKGFYDHIHKLFSEIEIIDDSKNLTEMLGEYNAYFITKHYIENIPDLTGIYNNDGNVYEVGLAVKDEKVNRKISVIGHEISPDVADLINQEYIDAVISQDPFSQGYCAMKYLCDFLLNNLKPELSKYFTKIDITMKGNLSSKPGIINSHFF